MYAADTNVYVRASQDPQFDASFAAFAQEEEIVVSAIVAAEIMMGLPVRAKRRRVLRGLHHQGAVIAPQRADWIRAAHTIMRLGGDRVTKTRSFWNDALLAAQCARLDLTLITANTADFARLSRFIPVRIAAPFPA